MLAQYQLLFNSAFGLLLLLGMWILNVIWTAVREAKAELSVLEVTMAKEYMPRSESTEVYNKLYDKLSGLDALHGVLAHIGANKQEWKDAHKDIKDELNYRFDKLEDQLRSKVDK